MSTEYNLLPSPLGLIMYPTIAFGILIEQAQIIYPIGLTMKS